MNGVNEKEVVTQKRILREVFIDKLGYTYLGNFKDKTNNSNVIDELVLKFLNRYYGEEFSKKILNELKKYANNTSKDLYDANKEMYNILKYGLPKSEHFGEKNKRIFFIDYEHPEYNDFYVAEEVTIKENNEKRPDIVIYINGIAIGVIELKRSTVSINEGIRQNCDNQEETFIKNFFNTIQIIIAGNDTEGLRYGTTKTPAKYYLNWTEDKQALGKIHEEVTALLDPSAYMIDNQLVSLFYKSRIVDLINNFIVFDGGIKKLPRYNQYFGVNNAIEFVKNRENGIYWHTQGSGKSLSMVWLVKWILSNITDARVVIFTDRKELDKQILSVFEASGEKPHRATSCQDLLTSFNEYTAGRIITSLIHKMGPSVDEESDKEYDDYIKELEKFREQLKVKGNMFVFVDECHRTQAGKLHDEMKRILSDAVFIGFTGTPLIKNNVSLKKFGRYIHTYKFDQAVKDGVVVDLCYEARNIEQNIGNREKIDEWFEQQTAGLTDVAKNKLKERWSTLQTIMSSADRLEEIVKDINLDFNRIPRLKGNGTAILVAGSKYEACRYWELFQRAGFKECAVISSYTPNINDIKGESTGENALSDAKKIYEVYQQMWDKTKYPKLRAENENDNKSLCFEDDCIDKFIHEPARMKLLIVVERLLTGFDAPSASYLYIDKSMKEHGLFQAICRVNRLDKEKDFGYIVDYKDLFENIKESIDNFTSNEPELKKEDFFGNDDMVGLLKDKLKLQKDRLDDALRFVEEICEGVDNPKGTIDYLHFFVSKELDMLADMKETEPKRLEFYVAVGKLVRSYANIADYMTKAGYTKEEQNDIKLKVKYYDDIRDEVMKAAGDYIELKNYDGAMRYLIDNYIKAEDSTVIDVLKDTTLLDIISANGLDKYLESIDEESEEKKSDRAALAISGNIAATISKNLMVNPRYYTKMSEMLKEIIEEKKQHEENYKEYLKKLVELAKMVKQPEKSGQYPQRINNIRLRGLYDCLNKNEDHTLLLYKVLNEKVPYDFMETEIKQRLAKRTISEYVSNTDSVNEIFELWKNTRGY